MEIGLLLTASEGKQGGKRCYAFYFKRSLNDFSGSGPNIFNQMRITFFTQNILQYIAYEFTAYATQYYCFHFTAASEQVISLICCYFE